MMITNGQNQCQNNGNNRKLIQPVRAPVLYINRTTSLVIEAPENNANTPICVDVSCDDPNADVYYDQKSPRNPQGSPQRSPQGPLNQGPGPARTQYSYEVNYMKSRYFVSPKVGRNSRSMHMDISRTKSTPSFLPPTLEELHGPGMRNGHNQGWDYHGHGPRSAGHDHSGPKSFYIRENPANGGYVPASAYQYTTLR